MGASAKGSSAASGVPPAAVRHAFFTRDLPGAESIVRPSSVANDVNLERYAHGYADHRRTPGGLEVNQRRSERGGFGATAASLA